MGHGHYHLASFFDQNYSVHLGQAELQGVTMPKPWTPQRLTELNRGSLAFRHSPQAEILFSSEWERNDFSSLQFKRAISRSP